MLLLLLLQLQLAHETLELRGLRVQLLLLAAPLSLALATDAREQLEFCLELLKLVGGKVSV